LAANYTDVIEQLRAGGLIVNDLQIGRMVRCKVEGDREKRGWYSLHEIQATGGDLLLVGSFGQWRGNDNGSQKIELRKSDLTNEQRESLRRRLAEDRKRAERVRKDANERAAQRAAKTWGTLQPTGELDYLARKGVSAHGLRFSPSGAAAVPMLDAAGKIHGLQIIRSDAEVKAKGALQKQYWPSGVATKGHFHLIGGAPTWLVIIAEGYVTAASIHEATGFPVAVAFDAGNLAAVAAALRKRYKQAKILVAADDDIFGKCTHCRAKVVLTVDPQVCPECGKDHTRSNAGVTMASAAALEVGGQWIRPQFADTTAHHDAWLAKGNKLTDFNDLHAVEGLHVVRTQLEARLSDLGWSNTKARAPRGATPGGEGRDSELRPIETIDELLERFALVYGQGGTVFDRQEHCLLSLSDMRDACMSREIHRAWAEHPERDIVRVRNVGFDPAGDDPNIRCNLWAGWPTTPKAGKCDKLLELLRYMCSADGNSQRLYDWVLNWVAYPLQHPGAKMKTTLVLHGPQGTGKNLFFEALMSIYGEYGRVIDQSAIEDKHNDWASRKLFLIADEVVARTELFHVKNKLKAYITGEWIRINPKNIAAYDERNHANMVFLSNEAMPVVLEEDDRRHTVIWTPEKLAAEFYREVLDEVANGGVAALHDYLLHHDLGEFGPGTLPPFTDAKAELISLGLDSPSRFYYDLTSGEIAGVTPRPCLSEDLFELYKLWCGRTNVRAAPMAKFVNALQRKHRAATARKRYQLGSAVRGPHTVIDLVGSEMPPGKGEAAWLGEHVELFRKQLVEFKGSH
jgi:putative DNA primase/helicase